MNEKKIKEIAESLCEESIEDYIGLWEIPCEIERINLKLNDPDEIMEISLAIVKRLLTEGKLLISDSYYPFVPWDLTVNEVIERIRSEWIELGEEPNPGDIAWFISKEFLKEVNEYQEYLQELQERKAKREGK